MKKDNIQLICSIGEISNMFKDKGDIKGFLSKVVKTIAEHMKADVCSIYLLNEKTEELIMEATEGLNKNLTGVTRLKSGEGLVGLAMKELSTIHEPHASQSPYYKYIPESGEENFEAFLASPIVLGMTKIGVISLQHKKSNYFDKKDVMALKAIASQMAATLENVRLLMSIKDKSRQKQESDEPTPELIKGTKIVEGIAFAKAFVFDQKGDIHTVSSSCDECYGETLEDFQKALTMTEDQLEVLQTQMEEEFSDVASLIFSAHLLMLRDETFSGAMANLIKQGKAPSMAVSEICNSYMQMFSSSDNPRIQEKTQDIQDLGHRLLKNLSKNNTEEGDYSGQLIIAEELLPSELIKLAAQHVEGLVLVGGNATAHVSILARSLGVPTIITNDRQAFRIKDNTELILDANQGNLIINPSENTRNSYHGIKSSSQRIDELSKKVEEETFTSDGHKIKLMASINLLSDLKAANKLKAEGIGLYRSEFPFLIRNDFPSEEEQYNVYKKLIHGIKSEDITLRALDIGGDKILSYLPDNQENNPFLGLRAIRFLLKNKKIFVGQLKAMLRAGHEKEIRILFPLISSLDDFLQARKMVEKSMEFLDRDGEEYIKNPKLGVMIELPSAVEMAEDLANAADFISIGTNDLVQYMLGVDRTNDKVSSLYQMEHPAIIRAMKRIYDAAVNKNCDLSVCGNLTSNFGMVYYFVGLGIKKFSLNPIQIPAVQGFIKRIDYLKAKEDAELLIRMKSADEIRAFLELTVKNCFECV